MNIPFGNSNMGYNNMMKNNNNFMQQPRGSVYTRFGDSNSNLKIKFLLINGREYIFLFY